MSPTQQSRFLYMHSGGVTPVLNRTFEAIIRYASEKDAVCYISPQGILGALHNHIMPHITPLSQTASITPSSLLSTSRFKPTDQELDIIIQNIISHRINCIFIHGGDDSQSTLSRLQKIVTSKRLPLQCIGIPKTIDNDLVGTHVSPGYGSSAKYLATSFLEAAWDMMAMHQSSTKVFILETMGRNTGWLAAATTLASHRYDIPHILCVPERVHTHEFLKNRITDMIRHYGFCMITLAEGYPFKPIDSNHKDSFGHPQLGYQGPLLASWVENNIHVKVRYARPDCLQRSCGHTLSRYDWNLSDVIAKAAIDAYFKGESNIMIATEDQDFNHIIHRPLDSIPNQVHRLPKDYLNINGDNTSDQFINYLEPLITGEVPLHYDRGLPNYQFPDYQIIKEAVL